MKDYKANVDDIGSTAKQNDVIDPWSIMQSGEVTNDERFEMLGLLDWRQKLRQLLNDLCDDNTLFRETFIKARELIDGLRSEVFEQIDGLRRQLMLQQMQITDLRQSSAEMSEIIASRRAPIPDAVPALASISKVWCQVWHSPDLPKGDRNKTEWGLTFEVFPDKGGKLRYDMKMLYPQKEFLRRYRKQPMSHDTMTWVTGEHDLTDGRRGHLLGMLRANVPNGGTPLQPNQIAILRGHANDKPHVHLVIEGQPICITEFYPQMADQSGSASGNKTSAWQ